MADEKKRDITRPAATHGARFLELGGLIKRWRATRYKQPDEFHSSRAFSFSLRDYLAFESGRTLPSPDELDEISKALDRDVRDALRIWAKVQLTKPEHKAAFPPLYFHPSDSFGPVVIPNEAAAAAVSSDLVPQSERAATWVLDSTDLAMLQLSPWLADVLAVLAANRPYPTDYKSLGLNTHDAFYEFKKRHLSKWISQGRILETIETLELGTSHYVYPKSQEWDVFRQEYNRRWCEQMISHMTSAKIARRAAVINSVNKVLTAETVDRWIRRIGELAMEFGLTEPVSDVSDSLGRYTFIAMVAPAAQPIPEHVLQSLHEQ